MDYESFEMTGIGQSIFGNSNTCTLHTITINSAGGIPPALLVHKLTAPTTSVQIANVNHGATGGVTLLYDAACPNGFIVSWVAGVGDITVTFRETALGQ
jgi:hypothetical protein